MIVRMKKLTLLVAQTRREEFLEKLRKVGALHVKNIEEPSTDKIGALEGDIAHVKECVSVLKHYAEGAAFETITFRKDEITKSAKEILAVSRERDNALADLHYAESQMEHFKPWGEFDPKDIATLKKKGIFIRLYRTDKKGIKRVGERDNISVMGVSDHYIYFVHISDKPDEKIAAEEIEMPKHGFKELRQQKERLQKRIAEIEGILRAKVAIMPALKKNLLDMENKHAFLNVMHGMKTEKRFAYLQGFCPIDRLDKVIALTKDEAAGYLAEDPESPEETPTLIKNPGWISMINPVLKFMSTVPGYKEYDISFWFLLFFSIFFAMLVGDAGYGFIFLAATFLGQRKFKKTAREIFLLLYTLSISTIIWGAMSGTWFGLEEIAKTPFFSSLIVQKINSFTDGNQNFMIYLCFVIGAVQLTIAHLIALIRVINSPLALARLGWISVLWGLFFTAGTLVIGKPFPPIAGKLLLIGVVLIFLFSNPQRNIIKGVLTSLGNIPLKIIGSFGDIISYIRLFAVGCATLVLATTFNDMALKIGFNNFLATFGAALILFLGHTLNIALGLMSVIVHGIRLNILEFSGQLGMEWSGKEYDPFREKN